MNQSIQYGDLTVAAEEEGHHGKLEKILPYQREGADTPRLGRYRRGLQSSEYRIEVEDTNASARGNPRHSDDFSREGGRGSAGGGHSAHLHS